MTAAAAGTSPAKANRLVAVTLDETRSAAPIPTSSTSARSRSTTCSRRTASRRKDDEGGPFTLHLSITGNRLVFDIRREDGTPVMAHLLSLTPLRRIVKDYFMICDSYYRRSAPRRPTASRRSTWAGAPSTTRARAS